MLTNDLDFRLEEKIKTLYTRHNENAEKINWGYHEFLPWEKAKDFRKTPWDASQITLPQGIANAVETALLTEINLPWFTSHLNEVFKGSLSVMKEFVHTWVSEESQHSNLLENYLIITRNVNPSRLQELKKTVMKIGWESNFNTPLEMMAYTSIQELATLVFYLNVAEVAQPYDGDLATLLRRLAKDESLHYVFYSQVISYHLELQPNYCYYLANVVLNFQMPGAVIPDYKARMKNIAENAGYGPMQYFDQVLDVLVQAWRLKDLRPTSSEAEKSRLDILRYHDKLKKVRDKLAIRPS